MYMHVGEGMLRGVARRHYMRAAEAAVHTDGMGTTMNSTYIPRLFYIRA